MIASSLGLVADLAPGPDDLPRPVRKPDPHRPSLRDDPQHIQVIDNDTGQQILPTSPWFPLPDGGYPAAADTSPAVAASVTIVASSKAMSQAPSPTVTASATTTSAAPSGVPTTSVDPNDRATEFRPVEGGGEMRSGGELLVAAYAVIWVMLFAWLVSMWRKQSTLNAKIGELEAALDARAGSSDASASSPREDA